MFNAVAVRAWPTYHLKTLMKDTTISLKIERAMKAKLVALAKDEGRSLSNLILKILKEALDDRDSRRGRVKN